MALKWIKMVGLDSTHQQSYRGSLGCQQRDPSTGTMDGYGWGGTTDIATGTFNGGEGIRDPQCLERSIIHT